MKVSARILNLPRELKLFAATFLMMIGLINVAFWLKKRLFKEVV